jgi:hypothetical protein
MVIIKGVTSALTHITIFGMICSFQIMSHQKGSVFPLSLSLSHIHTHTHTHTHTQTHMRIHTQIKFKNDLIEKITKGYEMSSTGIMTDF